LPLDGVVGQAPSFDTIGWFARDPDLLARIGEVLLGIDVARTSRPRHLIIAIDAFAIAEPATAAALEPAVARLAALIGSSEKGAASPKIPLGDWYAHQRAMQGREAWDTFGDWIDQHNPRFGFEIADNFLRGMRTDDAALAAAREFRTARRAEPSEMLEGDVILCLPTAPFPAPATGQRRSAMWARRIAISTLTTIAGMSGAPQISLPLARVDGLPVGLSILARPGADAMLLAFARAVGAECGRHGISKPQTRRAPSPACGAGWGKRNSYSDHAPSLSLRRKRGRDRVARPVISADATAAVRAIAEFNAYQTWPDTPRACCASPPVQLRSDCRDRRRAAGCRISSGRPSAEAAPWSR